MGGGDDPPPYRPYDERENVDDIPAEAKSLAGRMRALFAGNTSKVLASLGLAFVLLTLYQSMHTKVPSFNEAIEADGINTRERFLDTGSNRLTAQLDLYDLLSIHSSSGSVNVGINVHAADKDHPVPAKLMIATHSGSIRVNMPALGAPEREYSVAVESKSASITGNLIHGSTTSVLSGSGRIALQFSLANSSNDTSSLSTASKSGSSDITLLPAVGTSSSIKQLVSMHTTQSGSLTIRYPREWEGVIEGHSGSGSLQVRGRDVEVIQKGPHYVLAKKGNGNSKLRFSTSSGSANVYFG